MNGRATSRRSRLFAPLVLGSLLGCSSPERAAATPETRMFDRSMAELGVLELVVTDAGRAERARRQYERIEVAFRRAEEIGARAAERALGGASDKADAAEPTDDEIRAAFAEVNAARRACFATYIEAQVELRKILTAREFAKLKEVR